MFYLQCTNLTCCILIFTKFKIFCNFSCDFFFDRSKMCTCVYMCVCESGCVAKRTSIPLLPERKESYQTTAREESVLFFFFSPVWKKSPCPSLTPLPWGGRESWLLRKEEEPWQDSPQVCAGHNHCLRHPWKVQLEGRREKRLGQREESQED